MTAYTSSTTDSIATDEVLAHRYVAVRNITEVVDRYLAGHTALYPDPSLFPSPTRFGMGPVSIGMLTLPLLFTIGGTMEEIFSTVSSQRSVSETLITSDTFTPTMTDVRLTEDDLITDDEIARYQGSVRTNAETLTTSESLPRPVRSFARTSVNQLGGDLLTSPMLMFPRPLAEVITRVHGVIRTMAEYPPVTTSLLPQVNLLVRPGLEPAGDPIETITRIVGRHRTFSETHVAGELVTRRGIINRLLSDTSIPSQTLIRNWTALRAHTTGLSQSQIIGRQISVGRLIAETMATAEQILVVSMKPRWMTETLTTHDAITLEQLLGAIMGYLWTQPPYQIPAGISSSGPPLEPSLTLKPSQIGALVPSLGPYTTFTWTAEVIGNMPDWTWYLTSQPDGDHLNVIEVQTPVTTADLTREK